MTLPLRGGPDYGIPTLAAASKGVDPAAAAEYAAYGFNRVDGLGRPVLVENCAKGLGGWNLSGVAGGLAPVLTSINTFVSPTSIKLDAGTGANGASYSQIQHTLLVGDVDRLGVEFAFRPIANEPDFFLSVEYFKVGIGRLSIIVDWVRGTTLSAVRHTTGQFPITVNSLDVWTQVKVVSDFAAGIYLRAVSGSDVPALPVLTMIGGGTVPPGHAIVTARATKAAANNEQMHIGYIVLTRDEP